MQSMGGRTRGLTCAMQGVLLIGRFGRLKRDWQFRSKVMNSRQAYLRGTNGSNSGWLVESDTSGESYSVKAGCKPAEIPVSVLLGTRPSLAQFRFPRLCNACLVGRTVP